MWLNPPFTTAGYGKKVYNDYDLCGAYPASILEDPKRVSAPPPSRASQAAYSPTGLSPRDGLLRSRLPMASSIGSDEVLCAGSWARQAWVDFVDDLPAVSPRTNDVFNHSELQSTWDSTTATGYYTGCWLRALCLWLCGTVALCCVAMLCTVALCFGKLLYPPDTAALSCSPVHLARQSDRLPTVEWPSIRRMNRAGPSRRTSWAGNAWRKRRCHRCALQCTASTCWRPRRYVTPLAKDARRACAVTRTDTRAYSWHRIEPMLRVICCLAVATFAAASHFLVVPAAADSCSMVQLTPQLW